MCIIKSDKICFLQKRSTELWIECNILHSLQYRKAILIVHTRLIYKALSINFDVILFCSFLLHSYVRRIQFFGDSYTPVVWKLLSKLCSSKNPFYKLYYQIHVVCDKLFLLVLICRFCDSRKSKHLWKVTSSKNLGSK